MKKKPYKELSVHERINFRSGFDVAVARESGIYNRLSECLYWDTIPVACCQQVYNADRFWCSLRTLRAGRKQF